MTKYADRDMDILDCPDRRILEFILRAESAGSPTTINDVSMGLNFCFDRIGRRLSALAKSGYIQREGRCYKLTSVPIFVGRKNDKGQRLPTSQETSP